MTVPAAVVVPGPPAPSPEPGLSPEAVVEGVLGHAMHVMALELKPHPTRPKDALPRLAGIDEPAQQLGIIKVAKALGLTFHFKPAA